VLTDAGRFTGRAIGELAEAWAKEAQARREVQRPAPKPTTVTERPRLLPAWLTVKPPAVKLQVDGVPVATGKRVSLKPGRHVATLRHPSCADCGVTKRSFRVKARRDGKPDSHHFNFAFQPMKIHVACAEGTVSIKGKVVGGCGKTYSVPVYSTQPELVTVIVRFPDGSSQQRKLTGRRGHTVTWKVR